LKVRLRHATVHAVVVIAATVIGNAGLGAAHIPFGTSGRLRAAQSHLDCNRQSRLATKEKTDS